MIVPQIILGSTSIKVSRLGLGTVKIGRNQGVKYPTAYDLPADYEVEKILDQAQSLGVNLLDTAPAYGTSETRLGKLLAGKRTDWVIASKAGEEFQNNLSTFNFSKKAIIHSIERSLKRLRTDYLDILLIHSDGNDLQHIEKDQVFETLSELKKKGYLRAYGMSTKTLEGGLATVEQADVVMVTYNPLHTQEAGVLEAAHRQQKGVLIKKALLSGHLNTDYSAEQSIQFVLSHPGVSSLICGTLNSHHLAENALYVSQACTTKQT